MSQQNVEMVRLPFTALEGGGYRTLATRKDRAFIAEVVDPEFELISLLTTSTGGHSYRGHEGVRDYARDMKDAWEYFRNEIKELHHAGDQVVAIVHVQARARERRSRRPPCRAPLGLSRRQGPADAGVRRRSRCPRSRGAAGVGVGGFRKRPSAVGS